jgi:hypothetical protein
MCCGAIGALQERYEGRASSLCFGAASLFAVSHGNKSRRRALTGHQRGVAMENHLLHAAKWLLLAIESADPDEQAAILNAAQGRLSESERMGAGGSQSQRGPEAPQASAA